MIPIKSTSSPKKKKREIYAAVEVHLKSSEKKVTHHRAEKVLKEIHFWKRWGGIKHYLKRTILQGNENTSHR